MSEQQVRMQALGLMAGYYVSQALCVAAKLGVADALAEGPKSGEALAEAVSADAGALTRLLRMLCSFGVFQQLEDGTFAQSEMSEYLRKDHPESIRGIVTFQIEPYHWEAWGNLEYSVKTGEQAFDHVYGMPFFEYIAQSAEQTRMFDEAMTSLSLGMNEAIVAAYDASDCKTLVDVGGGHGGLMAAMLEANPKARGVLFDQAHVLGGAAKVLRARGVEARCECVAGDFFAEVPSGGDLYLMRQIIHDWSDEQAVEILKTVRRAIGENVGASGAKLVLVEQVMPDRAVPGLFNLLDLEMLVMVGGKERTASEFTKLLADAGFRVTRVVETGTPYCLIEAAAV